MRVAVERVVIVTLVVVAVAVACHTVYPQRWVVPRQSLVLQGRGRWSTDITGTGIGTLCWVPHCGGNKRVRARRKCTAQRGCVKHINYKSFLLFITRVFIRSWSFCSFTMVTFWLAPCSRDNPFTSLICSSICIKYARTSITNTNKESKTKYEENVITEFILTLYCTLEDKSFAAFSWLSKLHDYNNTYLNKILTICLYNVD